MSKKIGQKYLKECAVYDETTGYFLWKKRPKSHFNSSIQKTRKQIQHEWNLKHANKIAGTVTKAGYVQIYIDNIPYYSHRLAVVYIKGYNSENQIDHIDGIKSNNKWNNLREVNQICNSQNCKISKRNKSGVVGVHWNKSREMWEVGINVNKKSIRLGCFENFEDAVKARYNEEQSNPLWTCSVESSAYKYLKEHNLSEDNE